MTQPPASRGARSRIVIDVARAQAEARRKSPRRFGRAGRFLSIGALAAAALVLVLLVVGYAWWQGYKKSPAYSLALLVDAAQRNDVQTVDALVDSDSVAQGFIPQVIDNLAGANVAVPPQARAQLTAALPQLLPRVRETMRDEIARSVKDFSKNASGRVPFFVSALGMRSLADVKQQGDAASVTVKAGDRPVELSMRRDGERWRVVTVKDERLAGEIAARLASSLPASTPAQPQNQTRHKAGR
jgi:hypothetical protein